MAGIYNVTFGSINRTSGGVADGYEDLSCTIGATVTAGVPVSISVTTGTNFNENVRVWIDYNNDGIFNATSELAFSSNNKMLHTGSITIPGSATVNTALRMRVLADASVTNPSQLTPCFTPVFSQVEDYKVTVSSNAQPPVAAFAANDTVTCSGTIQFTDQSINLPTSWLWRFGDGDTSINQNPSHTYQTPGNYTVTLIATNSAGTDSLVKANYIQFSNAIPGPASCTPSTTAYCCGYGITNFTLGSINNTTANASVGYQNFTCGMSADLTEGVATPFSITNGNNPEDVAIWIDLNNDNIFSSNEMLYSGISVNNPTGTLLVPAGAVKNTPLRLRVVSDFTGGPALTPCGNLTNGQAEDYTVTVLDNINPPVADFTTSSASCTFTIDFIDLTTNAPSSFLWYFGDGDTSALQNPTHTYASSGIYDVALVATNANGSDSVYKAGFINISIVQSYPYFEDFENGNGGWTAGGVNSDWALGTPNDAVINSAASGSKAWVTDLTGNYNNNQQSSVTSDCFDFTGLSDPVISIAVQWESEYSWDGAVLQSSIDVGNTWQNVGAFGDPDFWYNDNSINAGPGGQLSGWSGDGTLGSGGWVNASHALNGLAGAASVRLRIAFASDQNVSSEGFAFDNVLIYDRPAADVAVQSIISPLTGCGLSSSDSIKVLLKNYGSAAQSNFPLSYTVNNGTLVTETFAGSIAPGATAPFTFAQTANLSAVASYNIIVFTDLVTDSVFFNDTSKVSFDFIPTVTAFPYLEDFENGKGNWESGGTNSSWALGNPTGTIINAAASGFSTWVTNLSGDYNSNEQSHVTSGCFSLITVPDPVVSLKIWYENEDSWDGAALFSSKDGGRSWQLVGNLGDAFNWYNDNTINAGPGGQQTGWTGAGPTGSGGYLTAYHDLTGLGGLTDVRLRVAFASDQVVTEEGFAFDDISIFNTPTNDVRPLALVSPIDNCGLTATEPITFLLYNNGTGAQSNIPLAYVLDGNTAVLDTFTSTILPGDTATFTFAQTGDFSLAGVHTLIIYSDLSTDLLRVNDTLSFLIDSKATISVFPFTEDFEADNGGWAAGGNNSSWEWGVPNDNVINQAASGTKAWVTNLTGNYNNNEQSWVRSSCFDLTGLTNPVVKMKIWWQSQNNFDGTVFQSSIDDGLTWQRVGNVNDPVNWYNTATFGANVTPGGQPQGWAGIGNNGSGGFVTAKHDLTGLGGKASVIFRFAFGSSMIFTFDGFAFDDFQVYDETCLDPAPATVTAITTTSASVNFSATGAVSYRIEYGPAGYAPGTGTSFSTNTLPFTITGLSPSNTYDVYVRSVCSAIDSSQLVGPSTFKTLCGIVSGSFSEGFETVNSSTGLPTCWTNGLTNDFNWTNNSGGTQSNETGPTGAFLGNFYMYTEGSNPNFPAKTAIMESPVINLSTITSPQAQFNYHMYSQTGTGMGDLYFEIESPANSGTWVILALKSGNQGNQWLSEQVNLATYATQSVRFRFKGVTGSNFRSDMAVDNFTVSTITGISDAVATENQFQIFPNPAHDRVNIVLRDRVRSSPLQVQVLDMQGRVLQLSDFGKINSAEPLSIDLHGLSSGIYFIRLIYDGATFTEKLVKY